MLGRGMDHPVFRPAGISYLHIPTTDPQRSASFYHAVFGWKIGGRPDHPSFEDGTGHVIGAWDSTVPVAGEAGIIIYIYVHSVVQTADLVKASGGEIVKPPYPEGSLLVATFRDPAGNLIGIWQQARQPG